MVRCLSFVVRYAAAFSCNPAHKFCTCFPQPRPRKRSEPFRKVIHRFT
jgi:hypothetical protein